MRFLPLLGLFACTFHPEEGVWLYVDEAVVEDTCGFQYSSTNGSFSLQDNGDGNVVIDTLDGADPFACVLDDKTYDCPSRYVEDVDIGLGAVVEVRGSAEGSFETPKSGSGSQRAELSCKNVQCEIAAGIAGVPDPCFIEVRYDLVWSE